MGSLADDWNEVKAYRKKKQALYEKKIKTEFNFLVSISKRAGDHWRIDDWDFWWTGTVRNYKTGRQINIITLYKMYEKNSNKKS